ncbi:MAG: hypothetical protein RR476_01580 [Cetobacterium sp.]|uniref:hypothetical protein n=1 Tax=Cetobacterium sp. TaxID=2071632 RepID=UPI002FC9125E
MKKLLLGLMLFYCAAYAKNEDVINMSASIESSLDISVSTNSIDFGNLRGQSGDLKKPFTVTLEDLQATDATRAKIILPTDTFLENNDKSSGKKTKIEVFVSDNGTGWHQTLKNQISFKNGRAEVPFFAFIPQETLRQINLNEYATGSYNGSFTIRTEYDK